MIIVTGATGFIGQRLVKRLVKKYSPKNIIALGWTKGGPKDSAILAKLRRIYSVKTSSIDLLTKESLTNLPKSPDLVFHLAGSTDTSSSDFTSNDTGTKNLIESISPLNKKTHIIFASTVVSFSGRKNCNRLIVENSKPAPTNGYGRSKLNAEKILKTQARKKRFRLTIARMPTVYGKGGRKDNFFEFLNKLIQRKSILSRLNWPGLTSFIYVDDLVSAMTELAKKPPKPGRTNTFILSAEELNLGQVFGLMYREKGIKYSPVRLPKLLWKIIARTRQFILYTEPFISPKFYNMLWRASLIVNDVIICDNSKLKKYLKTWRPQKLEGVIGELVFS